MVEGGNSGIDEGQKIKFLAPCLSLSGRPDWKCEDGSCWEDVAAEGIAAHFEVVVRVMTAQT